jgi:hypothetical protein
MDDPTCVNGMEWNAIPDYSTVASDEDDESSTHRVLQHMHHASLLSVSVFVHSCFLLSGLLHTFASELCVVAF